MRSFACIHAPHPPPQPAVVLECARAFSPAVEVTAPDLAVFRVDVLERLWGAPLEIARRIAARAATRGLDARVAVAHNPDAAIHAALGHPGITYVPPGEEGHVLADLSLALLVPGLVRVEAERAREIVGTLALWGVRSFGALAALPEAGIAQRFGSEGVRLRRLASGATTRALAPVEAESRCARAATLDHPVEMLEPLLFVLARLAQDLCTALAARGLAARELQLELGLEGEARELRRIRLAAPMRTPKLFLKLLELEIQAHPPTAPVVDVVLAVEPGPARLVQRGLFVPLAPQPEKLALVLARLAKLVGEASVGAAELLDTHRPDAFRVGPLAARAGSPPAGGGARQLVVGFHRFRPPLPVGVRVERGLPVQVMARSGTPRAVAGIVAVRSGPWRSSGAWWTTERWAREEWDVELRDGAVCRIYRDLAGDSWFVDGVYD